MDRLEGKKIVVTGFTGRSGGAFAEGISVTAASGTTR